VAQEIIDAGGTAIADTHSVAEESGAEQIVYAAMEKWGRVDVLINNAGVVVLAEFDEISSRDINRIIDTHLKGSMWMCRAVWPHMRKSSYGRIVNITSLAVYGGPFITPYAAAKAGVLGLTRGLATEGGPHGIKVNALAPHAGTASTMQSNEDSAWRRRAFAENPPELVAPVMAFLAHEDCPVSGRFFEAAGGHASEFFFGQTRGYVAGKDLSMEDVRDNIDRVFDRHDFFSPPPPDDPGIRARTPFIRKPYTPD
jgi:NAD(P)-dependent dehydrogenase (short-subunit alcohol dehydrogenase family)